jgi:large subunit ribosomal protein L24
VSVVIEGINVGKRHQKPRQTSSQTDRMPKIQQGGILDVAMPLAVSKVMLVCPKCHRPTRVAHSVLDDGRRVRTCKHCGAALEVVK